MEIERKITDYVHSTTFDEIPEEPLKTVKNMVLDVVGTTVAGAEEAGKPSCVWDQVNVWRLGPNE